MVNHKEKGFTLIEIIVALVLMAIIAAVVSMGFLQVVKGYVFAKANADTVEKGQMAITRIIKELGNCTITSGTASSVTFTRKSDSTTHTVTWTNGATVLLLDGVTLTDKVYQVNGFAILYINKDGSSSTTPSSSTVQVQITLQLTAAGNTLTSSPFTNRVYVGVL